MKVRRVVVWMLAGAVVAAGLSVLDMARSPDSQTHLGRFASRVLSGGLPALLTILRRKALSNLGVIASAWTFSIPIALALATVIGWRRRDAARELLQRHRLLGIGLAGALAAGALGMVLNDSGVSILGMVIAQCVGLTALLTLDARI